MNSKEAFMGFAVIALLIMLFFGIAAVLFAVGIFNRLVALRNRFRNAFAQIDVQLKRRYDLIPNLVETAKAYLQHERGTLEAVIAARNQAAGAAQRASANPGDAAAMSGLAGAEAALTGTLGRLFALMEAYPDLKADQTVGRLHEELASTENRIAFARQAFNDAVMEYNTGREVFPAVLIANTFNFASASFLEIEAAAERQAPKVSFA
jgi:LemA protein